MFVPGDVRQLIVGVERKMHANGKFIAEHRPEAIPNTVGSVIMGAISNESRQTYCFYLSLSARTFYQVARASLRRASLPVD